MLTQKQEKYVQGLIAGMSQREAYRAAYDAQSMGDNAVDVAASRLLKNPKVSLRYEELRKDSETKAAINVAEIRAEMIGILAEMVRSDVSDYYQYKDDEGECVPVLKDLSEVSTKAIKSIGVDRYGKTKIEMYDRMTAMTKLCEMLGINADEVERESIDINAPEEYLK